MANEDIHRNADTAYYRGSQRSAINNQHVSSRKGRLGAPVNSNGTANFKPEDHNTDKYYRSGGSLASPNQPGRLVPVAPVRPGQSYADAPDVIKPIRVHSLADVATARDQVLAAFAAGAAAVIVEAAPGTENQLRTQLDLLVARETLKQEQYNAIRFRAMAADAAAEAIQSFGEVDKNALPTVKVEEEQLPEDFDKFVKDEEIETVTSAEPIATDGLLIGTPPATGTTGTPIGAFDHIGMPEPEVKPAAETTPPVAPGPEIDQAAADDSND